MQSFRVIFSASALLAVTFLSTQAYALGSFGTELNAAYPGKNLYTSCTVCHNQTNDDPTWFSQYGRILLGQGADDDFPITSMITSAGPLDFDNDGFTVNQEVEGGSFAAGGLAGNPTLHFTGSTAGAGGKEFGLATAPATLDALSSTLNNTLTTPVSHRNIVSGVVEYTLGSVATTGTVKLLFNTGGIQSSPSVSFVDNYSAATVITATAADADGGSWVVGADGSITISIADDGVFDLYSSTPGSAFYDPYAASSIIKTRLAITTASPAVGVLGGTDNDGSDSGTSGSLHCMTSGLGIQGLMFLALLAVGFMVRRKIS